MESVKVKKVNSDDDVETLFHNYLDICNKAIEKNKDKFLYQQVLNLGETIMGDSYIGLAIYDDRPKAAFSLYFKNNKLEKSEYYADVKKAWRMNLSYLETVVDNPKEYIEHPEKLDLDWLKSRLGFS